MPEYVVTDRMKQTVAWVCWRCCIGVGQLMGGDEAAQKARIACAHALHRDKRSWHEIAAAIGLKSHSSIGEMLRLPDPLEQIEVKP